MKRPYCCDASRAMFHQYYSDQQKGHGMPVYVGASSQRGHGLGNMIGSLFRRFLPYIQRGASAALRTGAQVFDDVRGGKKITEALKDRVPGSIKTFASSLANQSGSGAYKRKKATRRGKKAIKRRKRVAPKKQANKIF